MGFLSAIPAGLYAFALRIRHLLYDSRIIKRYRSDIPVVCVGNITVGGTGKTPVTEYLIEKLGRDYTVAVLRGDTVAGRKDIWRSGRTLRFSMWATSPN